LVSGAVILAGLYFGREILIPLAIAFLIYLAKLDLKGADIVCLSYFTPNPAIPARHACLRLRRRWPNLRIVLALWRAPPELLTDESLAALKADAVVTSVEEAVRRIHGTCAFTLGRRYAQLTV
jgi:hypothetical protein